MGSYLCCSAKTNEGKQVDMLASVLRIVSEPSRLRLMCILKKGEHCVSEITEHVDMSQSLISHHLRDLRDAKVVIDQKRGSRVYYRLTDQGKNITNLLFRI